MTIAAEIAAAAGWQMVKVVPGWLKKLVSSDRRRKERIRVAGLVAHYWTGASPMAQDILDISATGSYLLTNERWYPGTVIKLTLQYGEGKENLLLSESKLTSTVEIMAQVVRTGPDGVGLRFVFPGSDGSESKGPDASRCLDRKALEKFLERVMADKGELVFSVE
jgi:hypothetical protein